MDNGMRGMLLGIGLCAAFAARADVPVFTAWPTPTRTSKPWVYNWWMASAVDARGLEYQSAAMAQAGFGGFHIIPIYGAKGYEKQYRAYLSEEWLAAYRLAVETAHRHGLGVDLTMGCGWCFGGPWIKPEEGGWKLVADASGNLVPKLTGQKVKRGGPGGIGPMINPFSPKAMAHFLEPFTAAFDRPDVPKPEHFYHDSYEYFAASWDPDGFWDAFRKKRGYDLRDQWERFCGKGPTEEVARVKCDYRETLSDLIIEDVFPQWTAWCRARGIATRNEAHGAPANILDFYALADMPETEMFGTNDREILVSKFASSAAHVTGKKHVSAESCTWVGDHFTESLRDIKVFLDRLFLSGVNRVFYHGLCYSPVEAVWPGWCFYASLEMNPRNPIWRDVSALNAYVTRVQTLTQAATPDEDVLVYWPIRDLWWNAEGLEMQCTVHHREWLLDQPLGQVARTLHEGGYAFDYVSDRMLAREDLPARYRTLVIPPCRHMPEKTEANVRRLAERGISVVRLREGQDACAALAKTSARRAAFVDGDLKMTRFSYKGHPLYFIVNGGAATRTLAVKGVVMDPLTGKITAGAKSATLMPEHSAFVLGEVFSAAEHAADALPESAQTIDGAWRVSAVCGGPTLPQPFDLPYCATWETREPHFSGTMRYATTFAGDTTSAATLDLGEVCESAHVFLNGRDLGVRFMPPYRFAVAAGVLKEGANTLVVEVTNLGSNRLRWNDLNGVKWKYFRDANMLTPAYRPLDAAKRDVLPSGLKGPLKIYAGTSY